MFKGRPFLLALVLAQVSCATMSAKTTPRTEIPASGLSGLALDAKNSTADEWIYYAITDRGPNGDEKNGARVFLNPKFQPSILKFSYNPKTQKVVVIQTIPLKKGNGAPVTGLPPVNAEIPTDASGKILARDLAGVDTEGITLGDNGHFFAVEEYGPSLIEISSDGTILHRWSPGRSAHSLPEILKHRKMNRGFEALAWTPKNTLLLFLQSPMDDSSKSPVVEFDPKAKKTIGLYNYPMNENGGKIGDATVSPSGQVIVLEQNGKTGNKAFQRLYEIQLPQPGSSDVILKKEVANLSAHGFSDLEKLEGLSLTPTGGFAILNDNDFSVPSPKSTIFATLKGGTP